MVRGLYAPVCGSARWPQGADRQYGIERTKPGTINALAVAYYQSPDFRSLADSTKDHRRRIIDKFRTRHGDKPL